MGNLCERRGRQPQTQPKAHAAGSSAEQCRVGSSQRDLKKVLFFLHFEPRIKILRGSEYGRCLSSSSSSSYHLVELRREIHPSSQEGEREKGRNTEIVTEQRRLHKRGKRKVDSGDVDGNI